jgi:hypothetical protein
MASTLAGFESSGFLPVGTPKITCVCLSDYQQLPLHLWTDEAVHDKTCRGVR